MLQSLAFPAVVYALMLFVPGYLILRCARLPRTWAVCCAPIVSIGLVSLLGEAFAAAGIPATPLSVFAPLVGVLLVALVASRVLLPAPTDAKPEDEAYGGITIPWLMLVPFVAVGLAICNTLFVSELPAPDAIIQNYDVQHHLNTIRAFADAQQISSLRVNLFLTPQDLAIAPFDRPGFYPAAWYGMCSLMMQACQCSTPIAINASLAVTLALAYPLAFCAFACSIFEERSSVIAFTALTCVGFAMYPWCLLVFGPLYPNLVGFALMPASMALCMAAFRSGPRKRDLALGWVVAVLALLGQALLHPNTLFSMFVILVPFVAQLVFDKALERSGKMRTAILFVVAFLVVCLAFWTACYKSPVFAVVINEYWSDFAHPWQEVVNILTQTYTLFFFGEITAQVLMGALVIIGFVRTAYDRRSRWLAVSYLIACFICFVGATTSNATIKRFIAGFWYTDAMRLTATAITAAIPLAANGLAWVLDFTTMQLDAYNQRLGRQTHPRIAAGVIAVCFLVINFMPGFNWPGAHAESTNHIVEYRLEGHEYDSNSMDTTFGDFQQRLRDEYKYSSPIDVHERVFLDEVQQIVGDDLIINYPYDGSTLVYGIYGMRTYYRKAHGYGGPDETPQSLVIRTSLCDLATNPEVRQAVDDVGARYVLVLDDTYSSSSFLKVRSNVADGAYDGISGISPDTPGFTLVLSSGHCHLYRID